MSQAAPLFLDHNAGGPVDPRVLARFLEVESRCPANPASVHGPGRRARAVLEEARAQIAAVFATPQDDVVFVSGGTEANNLAVRGLGDPALPALLAPIEHASVMAPAAARGQVAWQVDALGRAVVTLPEQPVGIVCLVHGQSEVGTLQPIEVAADLAAKMQVPLHVDAAQTLGRVDLTPVVQRAASVSLSPHKCGGMRGFGVLLAREASSRLRPLLHGGGQEGGLRSGTVSPALAAATALAIELAQREHESNAARMAACRNAVWRELAASALPCKLLTPTEGSLPNTAAVAFEGIDGRSLLPALDLAGIAASHGSACSSGSPLPPRVLLAMGLDEAAARAVVRFSFSRDDDERLGQDAAQRVAQAARPLLKKI